MISAYVVLQTAVTSTGPFAVWKRPVLISRAAHKLLLRQHDGRLLVVQVGGELALEEREPLLCGPDFCEPVVGQGKPALHKLAEGNLCEPGLVWVPRFRAADRVVEIAPGGDAD